MIMNKETHIEEQLIKKLQDLKYTYRPDIRDRNTLECNFREKFETLNRVKLTSSEFKRLLEEIVKPDVFAASKVWNKNQATGISAIRHPVSDGERE